MTDPFVGQLIVLPRVFRRAESGDTVYNSIKRHARSASAACCRCTPTSARRSRKCAPATSPPRSGLKDATTGDTLCDPDDVDHAREDEVPRAGDLAGRRAQDQGRPGKDGHRAEPPRAGRPVVPRAHRRGNRPDDHLRHGRAAPGDHRRPHEARVRRRGQRRQAAGGLPRDHHEGGRGRGQVHQADRRPRPVRPRLAQDRAAARTGKGFEFVDAIKGGAVPREFIPAVEKGVARRCRTACWPATRWWTSR